MSSLEPRLPTEAHMMALLKEGDPEAWKEMRKAQRSRAALRGWARRRKDWVQYLDSFGSHERPRKLFELVAVEHAFDSEPELYWRTLGDVWSMAEFFHDNAMMWRALLKRHPEGRRAIMDENERAVLAGLLDPVTVWRGVSEPDHAAGFSWSLDREKAEWFARRWSILPEVGEQPTLVTGSVARGDVIAYQAGRKESEIIALPESVAITHAAPVEH
jgi:hypothetical protein